MVLRTLTRCLLLWAHLSTVQATDGTQYTMFRPNLDLENLGRIAFTGDFNAAMLYSYDKSVLSAGRLPGFIRAQLPDGTFADLAEADAFIEQMCAISLAEGKESVVVVGNFTAVNDIETPGGIALFDPEPADGEIIKSLPGMVGEINGVFCDRDAETLYLAGMFTGSNSSNALMWKGTWQNLPFDGFNGAVKTIVRSPTGSIIFGGSFTGPGGNYTARFNGLYDYDPSAPLDWKPLKDEPYCCTRMPQTRMVNATLSLDRYAEINSLATIDDVIVVAGNVSGTNISNIFFLDENQDTKSLAGGGLNGIVYSLYYLANLRILLVGGDFTNTADGSVDGLNYLAGYSFETNKWISLGLGVDGTVLNFNKLRLNITANEPEDVIIINGFFSELKAFDRNQAVSVKNIGVWVPSRSNWLANLDVLDKPEFQGHLKTSVEFPGNNSTFFAGSLSSWVLSATGTISFDYGQGTSPQLENLGLEIQIKDDSDTGSGVVAGLFHVQEGLDVTVVGGSFEAIVTRDGSRSSIYSLAFINNTRNENTLHTNISGVPNLPPNTHVQCLEVWDGKVFAGGSFGHSISGNKINGLFSYDLVKNNYANVQPPTLGGQNVSVQVIKTRPQSDHIYVGGTFETADDRNCSTVCIYNAALGTWTQPGANLGGSVTHMTWTSPDTLIIAGNITLDGAILALAAYNAPADQWTPFNARAPLEGVVTAMTPASTNSSSSTWSSDRQEFWIAGKTTNNTAFLRKWNGTGWISLTEGYTEDSVFHGLEVLSRSENGGPNEYINQDEYLLLLGDVGLPVGRASAALFNGSTIQPWMFTKTSAERSGKFMSMFMETSKTGYKGTAPCCDRSFHRVAGIPLT